MTFKYIVHCPYSLKIAANKSDCLKYFFQISPFIVIFGEYFCCYYIIVPQYRAMRSRRFILEL